MNNLPDEVIKHFFDFYYVKCHDCKDMIESIYFSKNIEKNCNNNLFNNKIYSSGESNIFNNNVFIIICQASFVGLV